MKSIVLAVICLSAVVGMIVGCDSRRAMSRQEVMSACKECTDAGFEPIIKRSGLNYDIYDVQCWPKK